MLELLKKRANSLKHSKFTEVTNYEKEMYEYKKAHFDQLMTPKLAFIIFTEQRYLSLFTSEGGKDELDNKIKFPIGED